MHIHPKYKDNTMKKTILILTVALAAIPSLLKAESDDKKNDIHEMILEANKANKRLIVGKNMDPILANVDESKRKRFWEIYNNYQGKLNGITEEKVALIEDYAKNFRRQTMNNEVATDLLERYFSINEKLLAAKASLVDELKDVLEAQQKMRYLQIENKLEAIVNFHLATEIPLVPIYNSKPAGNTEK